MAYVWDDHDYGPNDADASNSCGPRRVREAYRRGGSALRVPPGDAPINQAFTIGRVRVVRDRPRVPNEPTTPMLGETQKDWLLDELTHGEPSATPWSCGSTRCPGSPRQPEGSDGWAGNTDERAEIADAIAVAGIDNLVMVSGDAHMVAIDDGTNSDYSAAGGAGFPVLHTAALDRPGNVKGGPYSEGAFPGFGQFGVLEFDDEGGPTVTVRMSGRNWKDELIVGYERSFTAPPTG